MCSKQMWLTLTDLLAECPWWSEIRRRRATVRWRMWHRHVWQSDRTRPSAATSLPPGQGWRPWTCPADSRRNMPWTPCTVRTVQCPHTTNYIRQYDKNWYTKRHWAPGPSSNKWAFNRRSRIGLFTFQTSTNASPDILKLTLSVLLWSSFWFYLSLSGVSLSEVEKIRTGHHASRSTMLSLLYCRILSAYCYIHCFTGKYERMNQSLDVYLRRQFGDLGVGETLWNDCKTDSYACNYVSLKLM